MAIVLEDYQKTALVKLCSNKSYCLFFEQGTGKTITALVHLDNLFKSNLIKNALIVAPKSALGAWIRDMDKLDFEDHNIHLINYELISRSGITGKYDCIILDEGHAIKGRTSNRTQRLQELATMAKYRYILTGTPISNGKWEGLYSLFTFLFPIRKKFARYFSCSLFSGNYDDFLDRYTVRKNIGTGNQKMIVSYKNVYELQELLDKYSSRVNKKDVLKLPNKNSDVVIRVDLDDTSKKLYNNLIKDGGDDEFSVLTDNPLSLLGKLRTVCSGHVKDITLTTKIISDTKKEVLKQLISNIGELNIVIFAEFVQSIDDIRQVLDYLNIEYVVLDGRQKDKSIWRKYQENSNIKVIVVQYQSGSMGIELTKSNNMIFYEPTLSSIIYEQAKDRIHRRGQKRDCNYYCLCTKDTIEEDIYKALFSYENFNKKIFEEKLKTTMKQTLLRR